MRVQANGIAIEVDDRGPAGGEPVLLIMGLGMQLIAWPDELVADLVKRGHRVIRFDNRDIGLSQSFDHLGQPNVALAGMRYAMHLSVKSPYRLADMAADALGVLDALNLKRAHIVGASMGGMIAQHIAATQPQRVASLTLIMTTSGSRRLPQPGARVRGALLRRPASRAPEDVATHLQWLLGVIGSPAYKTDPAVLRERLIAGARRAYHPEGVSRQLMAVVADGDRTPMLARIQAPTLVIHGRDDPLIPAAAGQDLAARIPGAELDIISGMGHDLPLPLLPRIAAGIADNVTRAAR
jgi:pimeloyl-ACP methyl ester carboxylesterase